MKYIFTLTTLIFLAANLCAATFTSADNQFTIDMPSGWANASKEGTVLNLKKGDAQMEFKRVPDCKTESCLEQKVTADLSSVKAKKMKIVANAYTGEEIKRIDFSTGEPLFYINFSSPKTDFSAGYFMFNSTAYSVLTQNMSYAETDLLFSFISPLQNTQAQTSYQTYAIPQVESVELVSPKAEAITPSVAQIPVEPVAAAIKNTIKNRQNFTFVHKNMPSYIKVLGRGFDVLIGLFALWVIIFAAAFLVKLFVRGGAPALRTNPASPYPVKFTRMYGTPSVILKAKDNQGSTFVSFSTRWSSLFICTGLAVVIGTALCMCALSVCAPRLSAYALSSLFSVCALVIPMGMFLFAVGAFISLISNREFTVYNQSGKKAVYVIQKGFELLKEKYAIYYAHSTDTYRLERKKFALKRQWRLFSSSGEEIALLEETSALKAVLRRIFGHLWGFLRASYSVKGRLSSSGFIYNHNTAFNEFSVNIDKPQAIDALEMMATALVINIRDMDKYYPWIN